MVHAFLRFLLGSLLEPLLHQCFPAPVFSPPLPTPYGGEGRPRARAYTHCDYCNKDGHPEYDCFKKQRDMSFRT
jgi:hypothetical protein